MTPESLAFDIWRVVNYMLHNPTDYAVHVPGPNQEIALRAAQPDSDNHVGDIATVVRWVLFVTQFNEKNGDGTVESRQVRAAAARLGRLFERNHTTARSNPKPADY
jgi:hypothetical protein